MAGTVRVADELRRADGVTRPVADADQVKGCIQTVANDTARDAIPATIRVTGMLVAVLSSASNGSVFTVYRLTSAPSTLPGSWAVVGMNGQPGPAYAMNFVEVSASAVLDDADTTIIARTGLASGTITLTLPTTTTRGRFYFLIDADGQAATNNVRFDAGAGGTVNGSRYSTVSRAYESIGIEATQTTGVPWVITQHTPELPSAGGVADRAMVTTDGQTWHAGLLSHAMTSDLVSHTELTAALGGLGQFVPYARNVTAGNGLAGGGELGPGDVELHVLPANGTIVVTASGVAVGTITNTNITSVAWSKVTGAPTTWSWSAIINTPTTLAGYGITDGVATTDARLSDDRVASGLRMANGVLLFTGNLPTSSGQAFIYNGSRAAWSNVQWTSIAGRPGTWAWEDITSTPTSLAGYGIQIPGTIHRPLTSDGSGGVLTTDHTMEFDGASAVTISVADVVSGTGAALRIRSGWGPSGSGLLSFYVGNSQRVFASTINSVTFDLPVTTPSFAVGTAFSVDNSTASFSRPLFANSLVRARNGILVESADGATPYATLNSAGFTPFVSSIFRSSTFHVPPSGWADPGEEWGYVQTFAAYAKAPDDGSYWGYVRINGVTTFPVEVGSTCTFTIDLTVRVTDIDNTSVARFTGSFTATNNGPVTNGAIISRNNIVPDTDMVCNCVPETTPGAAYVQLRLSGQPGMTKAYRCFGKVEMTKVSIN